MGSEDINHVYGLFSRSKEHWSLYIIVRSFEKKKKIKKKQAGKDEE